MSKEADKLEEARSELATARFNAESAFELWRPQAVKIVGDWMIDQTKKYVIDHAELSQRQGSEKVKALRESVELSVASQQTTIGTYLDETKDGKVNPSSAIHSAIRFLTEQVEPLFVEFGFPSDRWGSARQWYDQAGHVSISGTFILSHEDTQKSVAYEGALRELTQKARSASAAETAANRAVAAGLWEG